MKKIFLLGLCLFVVGCGSVVGMDGVDMVVDMYEVAVDMDVLGGEDLRGLTVAEKIGMHFLGTDLHEDINFKVFKDFLCTFSNFSEKFCYKVLDNIIRKPFTDESLDCFEFLVRWTNNKTILQRLVLLQNLVEKKYIDFPLYGDDESKVIRQKVLAVLNSRIKELDKKESLAPNYCVIL